MTRSKLLLLITTCLCAGSFKTTAEEIAKAVPTADEILKLVRISYALQDHKLTGKLRDKDSGNEEPFDLNMSQQVIRFRFSNPPQIVHLDLTTVPASLVEVKPGGASDVPVEMYGQRIRGFDLTYEDLSMRFIYWPKGKVLGEESLGGGQKAWKVRVTNPDGKGPYGTVDIWVHQGSGGMAKMFGYDKQGKEIKRFEMSSFQKAGETYIPKEIRIETLSPLDHQRVGISYMTFDKPEKK